MALRSQELEAFIIVEERIESFGFTFQLSKDLTAVSAPGPVGLIIMTEEWIST